MRTPRYPSLYQINTRVWLTDLSRTSGRTATLDDVPDAELDRLAGMGFDWIWLLSVWQTGPAARAISRANAAWRHEFQETLPDLREDDIGGSGFAITGYTVHRDLGGDAALARLRQRLRDRRLRLLLDFVPNHTAPDHPWVESVPGHATVGVPRVRGVGTLSIGAVNLRVLPAVVAALVLGVAGSAALAQGVLITTATVVDGTGAPARPADVRIVDGRIEAVGPPGSLADGDRVVDARGLTLAPGFIDTHSHHDRGIFDRRDALAAVSQGVTTIVVGQDGESALPLGAFFSRVDAQPAAVNIASYAGHGTLRRRVMGDDYRRAASQSEVRGMADLLREEMAAGALGLSTGLEYDPGIYSTSTEVLALAKTAAAARGRYISHIRSEDREFWQALDELLAIGRSTGMPVQISHLKLAMRSLWNQGDRLVATLAAAREAGVSVTADVYPWTMWQSSLTVLYPKRNFTDRAETEFILREVASPDDLRIGAFTPNPSYAGKTVAEIAALRGADAPSTLMALIAESRGDDQDENVLATGMDERDVVRLLRWPHANICSDGELDGAHPRGFGSFTRVLGRYVRDERVLTLEDAVRKMTALSAANVGFTDRGTIRPGMAADLVLFDPATVAERATVAQPHAVSVGIHTVWVNGDIVYANGRPTGALPGRALRRPDAAR